MKTKKKFRESILVLNGSPQGAKGNTAVFLKNEILNGKMRVVHLSEQKMDRAFFQAVLAASALVFATGTYWDSWGSPLQEFFEKFTAYEGHPQLLGKPAAALVLMHSVGGKGVLSRLQGALNNFGFLIPPMSGMVYSFVAQESLASSRSQVQDIWRPEDFRIILANLEMAVSLHKKENPVWSAWPVDEAPAQRLWLSCKERKKRK